ncbi:arsenate reductase family protein [Myroides sp. LJL116]
MNQVYYLSSCSTCKRIMAEIPQLDSFELREIKSNPLTSEELEHLYSLSNSYEALFNKRAQLYKTRELKDKDLQEKDYRDLLLEHYTFLSRPVFVIDQQIFIGNSKKVIEQVKDYLSSK